MLDKKKKIYSKNKITPKRLEIGIHNVNKGLKIKFYIYIYLVSKMVIAIKKKMFQHFLIINFETLQ
jgi:hypothetical protein